jgi:N6-L-threonylcarbamoyladenine synthase
MKKLKLASELTGIKEIAIAGGVSANTEIRTTLKKCEETMGWKTYIPKFEYTTDNAAMIGIVGYFKYLTNDFNKDNFLASSRLKIND